MKNEANIQISKATTADIDTLAEFNRLAAWETEGREIPGELARAGVKAVFAEPSKGFYLVAVMEGQVVGQLMVTTEWSDWSNRYYLWIQSVYVKQESRKQKIFSKLYRHLLKMVEERNDVAGVRLYVEKNNLIAQKVYESLGMHQTIYHMYEA